MNEQNYFTMSDLLRVCDEFAAWLVEKHGRTIFPNVHYISYGEPDFKKFYEKVKLCSNDMTTDTFYRLSFLAFCKNVPEAADEIPVDSQVIDKICECVFRCWEHGDLTNKAMESLKKEYEVEANQ